MTMPTTRAVHMLDTRSVESDLKRGRRFMVCGQFEPVDSRRLQWTEDIDQVTCGTCRWRYRPQRSTE